MAAIAKAQDSARALAQAYFQYCENERQLREQYDTQAEEDWKNYCFNETLARQSFEGRLPYIDGLARDVESRRAALTIGTSVQVLNVYDNGCVCTVVLSGPYSGEVHYLAEGVLQDPFWVKEPEVETQPESEAEVLSTSVTMFIGVDRVSAVAGNHRKVALCKGDAVTIRGPVIGDNNGDEYVTVQNDLGWVGTCRRSDLVEAA